MDSFFVDQDAIARSTSQVPPTHYTLKIQTFSSLVENAVEKYESGEFEAGGYKWRLVVYPNGNKNKKVKDHISLYLTIANTSSLSFGWEAHVVFRLYLLDQNKDRFLILQDAMGNGRRFHGLKLEWGFDKFIPITTFNDASNGYLVKDTCVFGADVFVKERNINKGECLSPLKNTSVSSYKNVWKIENFSKLDAKRNDSEVFVAGDQKWKIHLYPKENKGGTGSQLSMYLALADLSTITVGKMVLPFEPLTLTFEDVQYCVDTPSAMRKRGFNQKKLQLLNDITGAFRPGILTALMGVSGAGKTTLMDVLSGRKTGGTTKGDIRIGGYPKVQDTFTRISGYCEQNDIHSPQITVEESVIFSAWLRLSPQIDSKTKAEFVNEVLQTIELDGTKDSLVGLPGVSGLSIEQRKRLTIAVELVANPAIMFMDEPTSSLDARAAAIVMRVVKHVVETGRTVVCAIQQPSIDIFEAFDDLVLMKTGGHIIYSGPRGQQSCKVIEYFESIPGVRKIKDNYNPATWILEVTCKSIETELGVDFAQIYRESTLYQENKELVKQLSSPSPGSKDLHFPTRFAQNGWEQFKACLWKQNLSYWRNPSYNLMRIIFISVMSVLYGILFWQQGKKINNQQDLFNIFGALYSAVMFFGINNCSTVLPLVSTERTVLYRERSAGMYSSWAYTFAQVLVEVPYLFIQAVIYVIITYPMIGYYWSANKILWSFYSMFCNFLYFNYLGMLMVSLTPNVQVAAVLTSASYTMLNLFSGFIIRKPKIPMWWIRAHYLCPTSWALNGMLTSQYGDIDNEISAFGETKTVSAFIDDYFGFDHDRLGGVGIVLIIFPVIFASLFAYFIGKLSFQRRN